MLFENVFRLIGSWNTFLDFIKIVRDSLQAYKEEKIWYLGDYLSPNEAEVIAEDLIPYDKEFLHRIYTDTDFYQTELPEFFQHANVITATGSVAYFRVNFLPLRPVFLHTLKKLSIAVKGSLQSKDELVNRFKKELEKQRFEEEI